MFKNLTLKQLAIYAASLIAGFFMLLTGSLLQLGLLNISWINWLLISLALFGIVFFIIIKLLEKYIYRRIKLIYKVIHKSKISVQDDQQFGLDEHIIEKVENEVSTWLRDQQQEIQSLKNLEKYRRNFLGNISHELKTPIFSIQGYIHTLLDGGIHDPNINMDYLRRAANNVERLQTIVEDLEIISKLETGNMMLDLQQFDIRELAREVIEDVEMQARNNEIDIQLKEGAEKPFNVKGDREAVRTVLTNLLINSIKYGKMGGRTRVGFYDMDHYILIEVADNGIGIEEKHLKHLFDRFYRVDKSRSRDQGGTGLGLSIVKHIMEAHKQRITVRSTPGLGSTFGFTLEKARSNGRM